MYVTPEQLSGLVRNKRDAEKVIANLLLRFTEGVADDRLFVEKSYAKQSAFEMARRTASNLLRSFTTRRPLL